MSPAEEPVSTEQPEKSGQPELRFRLLFVDDEPAILQSLKRLMRRHPYDCWFAGSGEEGLKILEERNIDLIVSDMRMPHMDGAEFLAEVRRRWPFSVRFLMTGYADMKATIDALNLGGINRYISKPWDDEALLDAIGEGLRIRRLEREKKRLLDTTRRQNEELQAFNHELESRVKERTGELREKSAMLRKAFRQLEKGYDTFVRVFASVISSRPQLAKGQSRQVAELSRRIAQDFDLDKTQIKYVYYAALLHEIGKLNLPDDLLLRAEVHLTHRDLVTYRKYPEMGEMFLSAIKVLEPSARLIGCHTELFDGTGYPHGLKGTDTPLGARIIRVARDFVGLQSGLMRTEPLTPEEAFDYMQEQAGRRYDPDIVAHLEPMVKDFAIDAVLGHERRMTAHDLRPGMELTRDLVNHKGILLMTRGTQLNDHMIERMVTMERLENRRINVYVKKEEAQQ